MILLGSKVPPLPPVRGPQLIAETILGAVMDGHELDANDVREVVDFRHEHGGSRLNEAVLILARGLAKSMTALEAEKAGSRIMANELKAAKRRPLTLVPSILDQIREAKRAAIQRGEVFSIEDIRPILEGALT